MQSYWLFMIWVTLLLSTCSSNSPERFDPTKTVCLEVSKTLFTNVGTLVLGQDGKPISCTPAKPVQIPAKK